MKEPCFSASWMAPGTKVFCGEPLINGAFSSVQATEKTVDGEISSWPALIASSRFSAVSLTPGISSAYRSVLAVQRTTTLSRSFLALKVLHKCQSCSRAKDRNSLLNVLADLINMRHASLTSIQDIVCTIFLVRSDKIRVVNAGQGLHQRHFFSHHLF